MDTKTKRLIESLKEVVGMLEDAYEGMEKEAKAYGVDKAVKRAEKAIANAQRR